MTEKILVRFGADWRGMIWVGAVWCVTESDGNLTEKETTNSREWTLINKSIRREKTKVSFYHGWEPMTRMDA